MKAPSRLRPGLRRINASVAIMLAMLASHAFAGILPLSSEPSQPRANEVFGVVHTLVGCGDSFPGYTPDNRNVEILGDTLRVTVAYDLELCLPLQPYAPSYRWNIGPLAQGVYRIELYGYYHLNDPHDPGNRFLLSSGEVTIRPGLSVAPAVVPTNDPVVLVVLMMLVGGAGLLVVATGFPGKSGL